MKNAALPRLSAFVVTTSPLTYGFVFMSLRIIEPTKTPSTWAMMNIASIELISFISSTRRRSESFAH